MPYGGSGGATGSGDCAGVQPVWFVETQAKTSTELGADCSAGLVPPVNLEVNPDEGYGDTAKTGTYTAYACWTPSGSYGVVYDSFIVALPPTVTGVSPTAGPVAGGTVVTITGADFVGGVTVMFGTNAGTDVSCSSTTSCTATSPVGAAGTVDLTVTTPQGTSATSWADQFSYGPPAVTGVSPDTGPSTGGTAVTITGTALTSDSTVMFGTNAGTDVSCSSSTSCTATSPAGTPLAAVDVTVTTPGGTSATSSADEFSYVTLPPTIQLSVGGSDCSGSACDEAFTTSQGYTPPVDLEWSATAQDYLGDALTPSCTPSQGSDAFSIGVTTVLCTATDQWGNTASASFTVTVIVNTPPVVQVPSNVVVYASSLGKPTPSYVTVSVSASAQDAVGDILTPTCTPGQGPEEFPIGTTTVLCTATDQWGNTGHAYFTVTYIQNVPPIVQVPSDVTFYASNLGTPPPPSVVVPSGATAYDAIGDPLAPSCSPSSAPIGTTTTVLCTATDQWGNTASAYFTVTYIQNVPPIVQVPSDIVLYASTLGKPTPPSVVVSFTATAYDAIGDILTPSCNPSPGYEFPIGTTTVLCTATDQWGNTGHAYFTVTYIQNVPPIVQVPSDIVLKTSEFPPGTPPPYVVPFEVTAYDAIGDPLAPSCSPSPGSLFSIGITTVTCTATDAWGNTASAYFTVTIIQNVPPTITVPSDITTDAASPSGAPVSFAAAAYDIVGDPLTPSCSPSPGSLFSIGITTVTCTATDQWGNTASAYFTVTVNPSVSVTSLVSLVGIDVGQTYSYSVTASGGSGSYTYAWTIPASDSVSSGCGTSSNSCSIIGGFGGTGAVSVKVTDNLGESASSSSSLAVYADPTVSASPASSSFYVGQSSTNALTATVTYKGSNTYVVEWFVSSSSSTCTAAGSSLGSGTSFTPSTMSAAITWYCAVVSDSGLPGYASASNVVVVNVDVINTALSSAEISVGSSTYDTATLAGVTSSAGGTVKYEYFTNDGACSTTATGTYTEIVSSGTVPNSPSVTFTTAGLYSWEAIYSGDSNNAGTVSGCEPLSVVPSTNAQAAAGAGAITDGGHAAYFGLLVYYSSTGKLQGLAVYTYLTLCSGLPSTVFTTSTPGADLCRVTMISASLTSLLVTSTSPQACIQVSGSAAVTVTDLSKGKQVGSSTGYSFTMLACAGSAKTATFGFGLFSAINDATIHSVGYPTQVALAAGVVQVLTQVATTTSVSCTPSTGTVGVSQTCTAAVSNVPSFFGTSPGGTVTFSGTLPPGMPKSCTMTSGSGTSNSCSVTWIPASDSEGSYSIVASYGGDSTHAGSTSSSTTLKIQTTVTTTVSCSLSGTRETCTVTIANGDPSYDSKATGTVTFSGGPAAMPTTCTLSSGSCSVSWTVVSAATYTVKASYSGDTTHASSTGSTTFTT